MRRNIPISTYRLQLTKQFPFKQAEALLPYLQSLGVDMLYCSPYFKTEKDSLNPYKIVSINAINPELGGKKAFTKFLQKLQQHQLSHMIDFVPNHMGACLENLWWRDVLQYGKDSLYAGFFSIDWDRYAGKIMLPILSDGSKMQKQGKGLQIDDKLLPLAENTDHLPVAEMLSKQHYILCHHKETHRKLNYRRFFDIADLVGLKMENPQLFALYHQSLFEWIKEKKIQGIRIDHPDGLFEPRKYLVQLRKHTKKLYIICEKILQQGEDLCSNWPVEGTVGYEMLNLIDGIFVQTSAEKKIDAIYTKFTKEKNHAHSSFTTSKVKFFAKISTKRGDSNIPKIMRGVF